MPASLHRYCCYLKNGKADGEPCRAPAEWELYGSKNPNEPIDACTDHVGALLDDSATTSVFPIGPTR